MPHNTKSLRRSPPQHRRTRVTLSLSPVVYVRDRPVVLQVYVESLGLEVFGHHHPGLDHTGLLWKVPLAE